MRGHHHREVRYVKRLGGGQEGDESVATIGLSVGVDGVSVEHRQAWKVWIEEAERKSKWWMHPCEADWAALLEGESDIPSRKR